MTSGRHVRGAAATVLVANRGEIAVRVIRACRELGLGSVAVFSECDRLALHVRMADQAFAIGDNPARDSYLRIDKLIDVARRSGASLVHPGYGFLAENAEFAQACVDAGLTFVGPSPEVIRLMGSKTAARQAAVKAGVPVVPGTDEAFGPDTPIAQMAGAAGRIGYPLLVKAVAGGGGKGMRVVSAPADLAGAVRAAQSEATSSFGDGRVFLERRVVEPRHIEIQLLGDHHGTVIPFVERECSIQRRHQKVVEESPSLAISDATRRVMAECAARIARDVGYTNAGTMEFLVDRDEQFYFLEMNTRLQVEHPITEAVTGVDLVQWQIRIANGDRLTIPPERAITPRGHAIECRIYAEDPDRNFLPAPGRVAALSTPAGPGVRDDRGVAAGFEIPVFYDSMISKLVVWAETRPQAILRLARALDEYRVVGVATTIPFFQWLVQQPDFGEGRFDTTYLDRVLAERDGRPFREPTDEDLDTFAIAAAIAAWRRLHTTPGQSASEGPSLWERRAREEGLR